MTKTSVYDKILAVAEELIQTRGYNAFSFRDIEKVVGVKTASIHYHFPTKEALGTAVVERHIDALEEELQEIANRTSLNCKKKLRLIFDTIFKKTYASNRKMCLGGMLASDVLTLPEPIQSSVRIFFNRLEKLLEHLLQQGKSSGEFTFTISPKQQAIFILSLLEGSLLLARLFHDENRLQIARKQIESLLTSMSVS